jgi:DNA-3-methyladenine glycosylase I
MKSRCPWAESHPLLTEYHDTEWGVPLYDDRRLFEFIILDGMQAGLSWLTILKKRESFRKAFSDFEAAKVARYREPKVERLMNDPGIIRNRQKIEATIGNARAYLSVLKEYGSFCDYIWGLAGDSPKGPAWPEQKRVPSFTPQSEAMSKALVKRGFRFVGPTICYAFMQAAGMVNDHVGDCFRYREVERLRDLRR